MTLPPARFKVWRQAMKDRLVSDARVLANAGESCVIISGTQSLASENTDIPRVIFLYSLRDYNRYQLPPIAQCESGFPYNCECIALDGRVYVLGGTKKSNENSLQLSSKDVYVLDLAAPRAVQRQWKLCASMQAPRANFRCGAKDGKIYVFGGTNGKEWVNGSEVYDPKLNSWSAITPMPSFRGGEERNVHQAVAELKSCSLHDSVPTGGEELVVVRREPNFGSFHLMVYHPVTCSWETLSDNFRAFTIAPDPDDVDLMADEDFMADFMADVDFLADGKLHSFSLDTISVYDIEKNQRTQRYSCSYRSVRHLVPRLPLSAPLCAVAVDDEIVVLVAKKNGLDQCLVKSIGFGRKDVSKIVWEVLPCSFPSKYKHPSICSFKI